LATAGLLILFSAAERSREEDRSRAAEAESNIDYSSLNMTSLNANVFYDTIQPTAETHDYVN